MDSKAGRISNRLTARDHEPVYQDTMKPGSKTHDSADTPHTPSAVARVHWTPPSSGLHAIFNPSFSEDSEVGSEVEKAVSWDTSDGYHTFAELYDHRCHLMIALMLKMPECSWRADKNDDGEKWPDWFLAGINLPTGTITYHLPQWMWGLLEGHEIKTYNVAPEWDGHTSADVIKRLSTWINRKGKSVRARFRDSDMVRVQLFTPEIKETYRAHEVHQLIHEVPREVYDEIRRVAKLETYDFVKAEMDKGMFHCDVAMKAHATSFVDYLKETFIHRKVESRSLFR